jgi:hypothetical protein
MLPIDFAPIQHYTMTKAICDEIAHIKLQRKQYRKSLTKQERRDVDTFRHRFDYHYNPTLVEEGLKAFAADCYEPLNIRDNSIIQLEWRRDNLTPADIPISYE